MKNFQSRFGSDTFSLTSPSSDLIISCSTSYYEAENKYILEEDHLVVGSKKIKLSPQQAYKIRLDKELDIIQGVFQY